MTLALSCIGGALEGPRWCMPGACVGGGRDVHGAWARHVHPSVHREVHGGWPVVLSAPHMSIRSLSLARQLTAGADCVALCTSGPGPYCMNLYIRSAQEQLLEEHWPEELLTQYQDFMEDVLTDDTGKGTTVWRGPRVRCVRVPRCLSCLKWVTVPSPVQGNCMHSWRAK